MTERETSRLLAWNEEIRRVHARLRDALALTQQALDEGRDHEEPTRELLLYCHGFCTALDGHHRGEDRTLFPAIEAAHPELSPVLRNLERDHSVLSHLIAGLLAASGRAAGPAELESHLEGIAALMENHFRYEERQLLTVLETLDLEGDRSTLGPL